MFLLLSALVSIDSLKAALQTLIPRLERCSDVSALALMKRSTTSVRRDGVAVGGDAGSDRAGSLGIVDTVPARTVRARIRLVESCPKDIAESRVDIAGNVMTRSAR